MTMPRDEVLKVLARHIGDAIVVAVYQTCFDWMALCPRDLNYVSTGAMGQASSHALGLALGRPDKKVVVFDGDGSLLMNLGSLVTIASVAPSNLYHFVFANGVYEVNGAHPLPGGAVDFRSLAAAAGYAWTARFDELSDFAIAAPGILERRGPIFCDLKIHPGAPYPRDYETIHGADVRARFRAALESDRPSP